ncbi:MAG: hypothetical protein ACRBN8_06240 [Nannocystales bacterium]
MPTVSRGYAFVVPDNQPVKREVEMVVVYSALTFIEVELAETAFRAHGIPYVIRYKVRYMEPTFAGDELRTSQLLVPRSVVAEAEALLQSLRSGERETDGPSDREHFEARLDTFGTPDGPPATTLWDVGPENFGDWVVASLPDLLERLSPESVLEFLEPLDAPQRQAHRAEFIRALTEAPAITRSAILDGLGGERPAEPESLRAVLMDAANAG